MMTKPLVAGLLAAGCLSAAAGGAYVAVRQNAADLTSVEAMPASPQAPANPAVAESEAVVVPQPDTATPLVAPSSGTPGTKPVEPSLERPTSSDPGTARPPRAEPSKPRRQSRNSARPLPPSAPKRAEAAPARRAVETVAPEQDRARGASEPVTAADEVVPAYLPPLGPVPSAPEPLPAAPVREFIQVVLPEASVIGLQVETAVSTERASVEDRVDARVTRDVMADGRVAIPAGSRVIGSVTLVERGGKIKERARLGVRFHTLVFADGSEVPIRTDAIYREGDSPSGESAKKIGGATVGGAILGAIIGGGKGAMIGGAAGAAGGTAATMAGGRNPATLPAGAVVTVRLAEPLELDLEKHER
jgi:hypothetical protein